MCFGFRMAVVGWRCMLLSRGSLISRRKQPPVFRHLPCAADHCHRMVVERSNPIKCLGSKEPGMVIQEIHTLFASQSIFTSLSALVDTDGAFQKNVGVVIRVAFSTFEKIKFDKCNVDSLPSPRLVILDHGGRYPFRNHKSRSHLLTLSHSDQFKMYMCVNGLIHCEIRG